MSVDEDSDFDYGSIKDILQNDSNAFLKGVKNTDVDWFLRDTAINPPTGPSPAPDPRGSTSDKSSQSSTKSTPVKLSRTSSLEPGSQLQTSISNTNDTVSSKTKPSVATIHEEGSPTLTSYRRSSQGAPLASSTSRRSSNASINSINSSASSKGGRLFSKLKGKFSSGHKDLSPPVSSPPASPPPVLASPTAHSSSVFKENYSLSTRERSSTATSHSPAPSAAVKPSHEPPSASSSSTDDPRLEEYIRFYKQEKLHPPPCCAGKADKECTDHHHGALLNSNEPSPINMAAITGTSSSSSEPPNTAGRLTSFLRRRSSAVPGVTPDRARRMSDTCGTLASLSPSPSVHRRAPEPPQELAGLKPLKSVAFHSSTFLMDPPQQIPSRNPRKGNVEILPNGSYRIHPLSEEDKAAIEKSLMGRGGGIVVGGSGALSIKRPHQEADEKTDTTKESANDVDISQHAKNLGVDKPMISHSQHRYQSPVEKMALDVMYTRCCHLREILPIPAIMKQIPKGSMAPIPVLQMKNPTPTMVEVLTFADFIRIAPIICVSLDGVSLSLEQFKILLSAMSAKKQLEKLSLRNTPIDHEGWSLFCWFLSRNKELNKLDITQCTSLSVNILKKAKRKTSISDSKAKKEPEIKRMECNKENRSDMDWTLFTATIVARNGIEEIILTGCCITDFDVFEKFIKLAVSIKTNRLGLAYNKLSAKQLRVIVDCWLFKKFVRGIDLGYNDLSSLTHLNIFLEQQRKPDFEKKISESQLTFLSLNATNLRFSDTFKETFETVLMRLPNLKYLDLSNNPRLFGNPHLNQDEEEVATEEEENETQSEIVAYMSSKFPLFPKLVRLHLEHNELTPHSLSTIANILPFCKNLGYFSILGNRLDLATMSTFLQAVKNSNTLITLDCDLDEFPLVIKERLGLYSMRNMERLLYSSDKLHEGGNIAQVSKVSMNDIGNGDSHVSLTEQLNNILSLKAQRKADLDSPVVTDFVKRAMNIKRQLRTTIEELLKLQLRKELSMDGKETLIRFVFLESSINKGLQMIDPSLADHQWTNMKMLGLSEDQNNKYYIHEAERNANDVHEQLKVKRGNPAELSVVKSPVSMSRTSSRTSLNQLDKEEGSMMKLSSLSKFHTLHDEDPSISGEEIRRKLRNVDLADLDEVIKYLSTLKEKGITVGNVFNLNHDVDGEEKSFESDDAINFEVIKQKLKKIADNKHEEETRGQNNEDEKQSPGKDNTNEHGKTNGSDDNSLESPPPALERINSPEYGESLNQLYDEVVNDITKLDSHTD
ncbi:MAP-ous protein 1 [Meyerozyma sp. JA9]|nr:MAP-ous protein 1 [Meyerozyma sp. JA9]